MGNPGDSGDIHFSNPAVSDMTMSILWNSDIVGIDPGEYGDSNNAPWWGFYHIFALYLKPHGVPILPTLGRHIDWYIKVRQGISFCY